jgi:hypothetical protein
MSAPDPRHPHERISALLDGELDAAQRADVESHLAGCAECRAFLEGLRLVVRAAAGEEAPPVPPGLEGRIGWRLRSGRREAPVRRGKPWWRSAVPLTAAASIAACGILVGLWHIGRGVPGVPEPPVGTRQVASPEKNEAAADRAVPPSVAAPPSSAPAIEAGPTPAPAPAAAREEKVSSPRAPREVPEESGESRFAPSPPARVEEPAPKVLGGVVGGVAGGVMGGTEGEADRATSSPQPAAPALVRYGNAVDEAKIDCPSLWTASPTGGWILKSADSVAAGAGLAQLAERLGGHARGAGKEARSWRLAVPRDRWPELAAALRALGVAEADPRLPVPEGTACAAVHLTIVP